MNLIVGSALVIVSALSVIPDTQVLLQGVPINANLEDIERFLSGCEYDPSNIRVLSRQGTRMAVVSFPSPTAAMSAMITKNRGFCVNNQISMHVLQ